MGKDMALIPTAPGKYDYEWVDPADPRACEVKSIDVVTTVGETDNRLAAPPPHRSGHRPIAVCASQCAAQADRCVQNGGRAR